MIQQVKYFNKVNKQVAAIMNPIMLTFIGHMQGKVHATLCQDSKRLITLGQDDLILMWDIFDMTSKKQIQINNSQQQSFTCIDYCQKDNLIAVGTDQGKVLFMEASNTSNVKLVYKSQFSITNIKFSHNHRYLSIGTSEDKAVLYDKVASRFYRCDASHSEKIIYSNLTADEKVMISIGSDGNCGLYLVQPESINQLQYKSKYRMFYSQQLKSYINFSERPYNGGHLCFGGATTLQQLKIQFSGEGQMQSSYQIKSQIHQEENIRTVCWIGENIVGLSMQNKVTLWNYITKSRFHVINQTSWNPILTSSNLIFGVNGNGQIYRYQNFKSLRFQNEQAQKSIQNQNKLLNNNFHQIIQQKPQQNAEKQKPKKNLLRKQRKKPQVSKAAHLITKGTQPGIQSFYEEFMDNQFIFYNQYGCLIKRYEGQQQVIELQFHDKFKIRRMKFQSRGKYYCYFALSDICFMYSSLSHFYFQMEVMNKNKSISSISKETFLSKWDYKISGIEGLAIGNAWVAVACKNQIRIFDFNGNQLHCLCFDRLFMALAAYEDLLALTYTSGIPLAQAQLLQLKIYSVNSQLCKLQKIINMPIKAESNLKWFGFSTEGCLFNQDSSQTIRMLIWDKDQWVNVFEQDSNKYKIYIQHIEGYDIYGFKVEQKVGQPTAPTVLPRSLPRKIPFYICSAKLSFLNNEENKRLQSIFIGRLGLLHQRFRSRRWYKYKYSRTSSNSMYRISQKVKSQQEIQQMTTQSDIYVVDQISKVLPSLKEKLNGDELQRAKFQILALCHSILFYSSSVNKIMSILNTQNIAENYVDSIRVLPQMQPTKYRGLKRLQILVDRGWIQRLENNQ